MKKPAFITVVVVCSTILATGSVLAKPGDNRMRMDFDEIDANGDGQITRKEIGAIQESRFASTDTNGDGSLSLDELTKQATERAEKRAQKMLERLDSNNDGVLSKEELSQRSRAGRMFDRADANDDGVITKAEFDSVRQRTAKRHGKSRGTE